MNESTKAHAEMLEGLGLCADEDRRWLVADRRAGDERLLAPQPATFGQQVRQLEEIGEPIFQWALASVVLYLLFISRGRLWFRRHASQ